MSAQRKPSDIEAMIAAYASGLSMKAVAQQLGLSESTVQGRLHAAGATVRTGNRHLANRKRKETAHERPCLGCSKPFKRTAGRWFQCQPCAARTDV